MEKEKSVERPASPPSRPSSRSTDYHSMSSAPSSRSASPDSTLPDIRSLFAPDANDETLAEATAVYGALEDLQSSKLYPRGLLETTIPSISVGGSDLANEPTMDIPGLNLRPVVEQQSSGSLGLLVPEVATLRLRPGGRAPIAMSRFALRPAPDMYRPSEEAEPSGSLGLLGPSTTTHFASADRNRETRSAERENPSPSSSMLRLRSILTPERRVGPAPNVWQSLRSIMFASWLNILLVFIPISWAFHFARSDEATLNFIFAFLAIIPLAKLLAVVTDDLSIRVGQTLAGLLNVTFGNAIELIVAIIALVKCQLHIVQSSLVGAILGDLLFVLGACFFIGGLAFSEQGFGMVATQMNSTLLTISVIAILLPTAYHFSVAGQVATNLISEGQLPNASTAQQIAEGTAILKVSHGAAVILLFIYSAYLFFQLYSHVKLYEDKGEHIIKSTKYAPRPAKDRKASIISNAESNATATDTGCILSPIVNMTFVDGEGGRNAIEEEEEEETPQMSLPVAIAMLALLTALVVLTAEWLVDSIDGLASSGKVSKEFVGVILLPFVGNASDFVTAVTVSVKDKLTLSLGVAVGSSIQTALFVTPFIIILGWILEKPLTLLFDPYESIALFFAVLTVNYVVQDGRSNWLEGIILMCLYILLALTFFFYPGSDPSNLLATCT